MVPHQQLVVDGTEVPYLALAVFNIDEVAFTETQVLHRLQGNTVQAAGSTYK